MAAVVWNRSGKPFLSGCNALRGGVGGCRGYARGDCLGLRPDGRGRVLYFTDRLKRMIKPPGLNAYPAQVEAVLHQHPPVPEACVVGVPDPRQVERVQAFVVLKDGGQPSPRCRRS